MLCTPLSTSVAASVSPTTGLITRPSMPLPTPCSSQSAVRGGSEAVTLRTEGVRGRQAGRHLDESSQPVPLCSLVGRDQHLQARSQPTGHESVKTRLTACSAMAPPAAGRLHTPVTPSTSPLANRLPPLPSPSSTSAGLSLRASRFSRCILYSCAYK